MEYFRRNLNDLIEHVEKVNGGCIKNYITPFEIGVIKCGVNSSMIDISWICNLMEKSLTHFDDILEKRNEFLEKEKKLILLSKIKHFFEEENPNYIGQEEVNKIWRKIHIQYLIGLTIFIKIKERNDLLPLKEKLKGVLSDC